MHEHFDAHRAYGHIERLAALRRLPGTPGEEEAARYIMEAGREAGLDLREEGFTYSSTSLTVALPLTCLVLAAICAVGSVTYLIGTPLAIIPGVVLLAAIYLAFRWSGAFERFGAAEGKMESSNLVAEIRGGDPGGVILLSAHYDSKSQLMPVALRAGLFMVGFLDAVLLALTLMVVGAMKAAGTDVMGSVAGFFVTLIPAVCLFLLVFNFTSNRSPGALDDASGIAVILEAGRALAARPPANFDVIIACFGCEEVGLIGSIKYLLANEERLKGRPFYMLNFDMPFSASGKLYINTGFELPPTFTSRRVREIAGEEAERMGFAVKGVFLPVGAAADHMPWVKHGFEATGFVSPAGFIHSSLDAMDKVDREGLRRSGELTMAVISRLDEEQGAQVCGVGEKTDLR